MTPFAAGLLVVAALALLVFGAIVAFQWAHADTVFPGVRIGDVLVEGMTRDAAVAKLRPIFVERASRQLVVSAVGGEQQISAADLGATFDAVAAVDAAYGVGRTGGWANRLAAQFRALWYGYSVESPGIYIERSRLQWYLAQRAGEIDRPVKDAELVIESDLSVRVIPSVVGRRLEVAKANAELERAVLTGGFFVELPVLEIPPKRVEGDLMEARATLVKMLSGPVGLEFEGRRWTLSAEEIAALVSVDQKLGLPAPVVTLRDEPLKKLVDRIAGEVDQPRVDARFDWNGGDLKVLRPGQDGRKVDGAAALAALKGAISGDQRMQALSVEIDRAAGGSLDPAMMGIKEQIEFGRTTLAGVAEKIHNIKLAASRLNGVVVPPGEIFSFNKELGPTTLKSGFQVGFGISVNNGQMETIPSVAGGICQVSTTLFHAVFWAGYQVEERYPHLYWIPNYGLPPRGIVGLDTTVDAPTLDFRFMNNTESYLLIQSKVEGNTLEFTLYGTKPTWKVEVDEPVITNVVKADEKVVRQEEPTWPEGKELQVESARDGMDVTTVRRVIEGESVRILRLRSHYQPSRNVLMVGTAKPTPTPTPAPTQAPGPASTPGASPTMVPTPVPTRTGQ